MKIKKTILIPAMLLVYLIVMATLGYPDFARGKSSAAEYFGTIAISLLAIVLLYFNFRYRDRLRQKRDAENDSNSNNKKS
jgi:TRAP-type uncharacterized transport system fused permease subunit